MKLSTSQLSTLARAGVTDLATLAIEAERLLGTTLDYQQLETLALQVLATMEGIVEHEGLETWLTAVAVEVTI